MRAPDSLPAPAPSGRADSPLESYENEFAGRVALITGGGGDGGGAIALRLAQSGARIAICDVHERRLAAWAERIAAATGSEVMSFVLDIADLDAVTEMVAQTESRIGAIDILVCNATENHLGHILEVSMDDWRRTVDVALTANFHLAARCPARHVGRPPWRNRERSFGGRVDRQSQ